MKGFGQFRADRMSNEIVIVDRHRQLSFTFEFKAHKVESPGVQIETTLISDDGEGQELLKALASALQQLGIMPESATTAELKATKFHLEDMRKLVFK